MNAEQLQIPVAEMEQPIEGPVTKYAIAPDGTIGEVSEIRKDMPEIQEKMQ